MSRARGPYRFLVSLAAVLLVAQGVAAGALLPGLEGLQARGPGTPAGDEAEIQSEEHTIESFDGIPLAATIWYDPDANESRPVVIGAHGWSQDRHHLENTARWLVPQGYHVLAWDARGFGESGGTVGLNGPDEWADVSALIDWIAAGDGLGDVAVSVDADGDPRIGMVGASYGGAIQLLAAAHDERIDAIVPDITWNDLVQSLAPDGVVKRGWVDLLYGSGMLASHGLMNEPPAPNTSGMDERLTQWFAEATLTGRLPDNAIEPLMERSPIRYNDQVRAHALITQGWHDTLFLPEEANATYHALKDREDQETHLMFYTGGHGHSKSGEILARYREHVGSFLARHLLDADEQPLPPVILHETTKNSWTHLDTWPPITPHTSRHNLTTNDGATSVTLTLSGAPTSQTDTQQLVGTLPTLQEDLLDEGPLATAARLPAGLQGPFTLHGQPHLEITITPDADDVTLFFSLVETQGDHHQVLYNQVTPVRVEDSAGQDVHLKLPLTHLAHTTPGGSQLELRVTTTDTGYHAAREAGTVTLHLDDARLTVPLTSPPGFNVHDPTQEDPQQQSAPGPAFLLVPLILGLMFLRDRDRLRRG